MILFFKDLSYLAPRFFRVLLSLSNAPVAVLGAVGGGAVLASETIDLLLAVYLLKNDGEKANSEEDITRHNRRKIKKATRRSHH